MNPNTTRQESDPNVRTAKFTRALSFGGMALVGILKWKGIIDDAETAAGLAAMSIPASITHLFIRETEPGPMEEAVDRYNRYKSLQRPPGLPMPPAEITLGQSEGAASERHFQLLHSVEPLSASSSDPQG